MKQTFKFRSKNYNFLDLMIKDIFFSKNLLNKNIADINPFYSEFEKNLKKNLKKIRDQRCMGFLRVHIKKDENNNSFLKEHREQGNLKARLIKNYDSNDELIIINSAGGLTSGDLNINQIKVSNGVKLNITSQSMEKVYKCNDFSAQSYTDIVVGTNSYVSWMPLETIFFNGGNYRRRINVDLNKKANFLGIETIIFGRSAMGETIKKGSFDDAWQIFQNGKLLYSDFNRINGNIHNKLCNSLIMKGNTILCNIVFVGKRIKIYKRKILNFLQNSKCHAGVSTLHGVLILKLLAKDLNEIRVFLAHFISLFDGNFNIPKIWSF